MSVAATAEMVVMTYYLAKTMLAISVQADVIRLSRAYLQPVAAAVVHVVDNGGCVVDVRNVSNGWRSSRESQ